MVKKRNGSSRRRLKKIGRVGQKETDHRWVWICGERRGWWLQMRVSKKRDGAGGV